MATFRVGQRVRVVSGTCGPNTVLQVDPVGITGVIVGTFSCPNAGFNPHGDYDVSMRTDNGLLGMTCSRCLEPILDDGRRLSTWDECAWKPPHLREVGA